MCPSVPRLHAIVGGCASYRGAMDHHLGSLAAALGRREEAVAHLDTALFGYRRLGAPGWTQRRDEELDRVRGADEDNVVRLDGTIWTLRYAGYQALPPDAKGVRDLATLLTACRPVHAFAPGPRSHDTIPGAGFRPLVPSGQPARW